VGMGGSGKRRTGGATGGTGSQHNGGDPTGTRPGVGWEKRAHR